LVCSTTVPDGFMGFKLFLKTTVPDGFMGFKLFLKTYKIIMPDRCKLTQTIFFLATLGNLTFNYNITES
jgi:hypothetical protein